MKSLLLIFENAAAGPRDDLDGRTPLQVARCPHATRLAGEGVGGILGKPPSGEGLRAEALLASLLGVPRADAWRLARGALEAEAVGADWATFNYAYRADLVTVDQGRIRDAHLARLSRLETERLVASLQAELDTLNVRVMPVKAGHAVVLMQHEDQRLATGFAPWLVAGDDEAPLPEGKQARPAREVMEQAARVLSRQTINDVRVDLGENPATHLWLWGGRPAGRHPGKIRWPSVARADADPERHGARSGPAPGHGGAGIVGYLDQRGSHPRGDPGTDRGAFSGL
jgi:2,3-bisphosphoglycerate-independent phosphoglycerate mutase